MIDPQHKLLKTFVSFLNSLFAILKYQTIIIFVIVVAVILFLKNEKRKK